MTERRSAPSLGRRLRAFGLDYLVVLGYLALLGGVGFALTRSATRDTWARFLADPVRMDFVAFCTTVLPVGAYFALFESSPRGATPGKRRMRLRVSRLDGERVGLGRAALRTATKLLPWQLAHTCLFHYPGWPTNPQSPPTWVTAGLVAVWVLVGGYLATIAVRTDRRAPYDLIAGTRVVSWNGTDAG